MGATIAQRLAGKICGFDGGRIGGKALSNARTCILDTIGVTLAGMQERCTQILLETPGVAEAPGPALIFGTDRRTSALDATLVNGTAPPPPRFDDLTGVLRGGPTGAPRAPPLPTRGPGGA